MYVKSYSIFYPVFSFFYNNIEINFHLTSLKQREKKLFSNIFLICSKTQTHPIGSSRKSFLKVKSIAAQKL